jgi:tetratricopeptide (TPR) repeat protein
MPRLSRRIITLYSGLLLLVPLSCMMQKNAGIDKTLVDQVRMEVERTRTKSEQHVVQGDYKSALDVYADPCRKYPGDQTLLTNYHKTIEDIYHAADEAFSREDFTSSGRAYYVLLKNYPFFQKHVPEVSFDKASLHARLEDSGLYLYQRALTQYRKGNLADAISIWKGILLFDPNNTGIMKAIDTTTIQMKNLRQNKEGETSFVSPAKLLQNSALAQ